jgi:hypothetical protein
LLLFERAAAAQTSNAKPATAAQPPARVQPVTPAAQPATPAVSPAVSPAASPATPAVQPARPPMTDAEPVAPVAQPVPTCDPREAEELRRQLERDARRARRWNLAWGITFGAAAVGSLAVGLVDPAPELRDGLFVSAGKAGVGALARVVLPLRIPVPEPNADTCADLAELRDAVAIAARRERQNFWLNHAGGVLVNGVGAAILWYRATPGQALLSVAVGYPIGLASNYTAPRGSWHLARDRAWSAGVVPQPHGWLVVVGGEL